MESLILISASKVHCMPCYMLLFFAEKLCRPSAEWTKIIICHLGLGILAAGSSNVHAIWYNRGMVA